jgi:hypothetical protein
MKGQTIIDIDNRQVDYEFILKETFRMELGIRAIAIMYDDHSNDKKSYENILILKDNIKYRLFSASYQYLIISVPDFFTGNASV